MCVRSNGNVLMLAVGCVVAFSGVARPASTAEVQSEGVASQKGMVRLSPSSEVWVDPQNKRVIVGGKICLRKGLLEMFACPQGTKEHESVVAVNAKAYIVHTALLAVGCDSGTPVQYQPEYLAASGETIQVEVAWQDKDGKPVKRRAQEMIRQVKSRKPMKHEWVFAGSGFWEDEGTGRRIYQAEGGEMICLSNFSTAMLDLPVESTQANSELLFEALTDNIPPLGTDVRLILTPKRIPSVSPKK